ncbi:MAG: ketose-bisphosphate aldolase [Proteobacteria bacterium]|nr:ketose-bisphosphate aldolase [Candidatus Enterousia scatequi]
MATTNYSEYGLVNTTKMFAHAINGGFAVPAFNIYNMETLCAIVTAARHTHSPLIIAVSESALKYMGENMLMGMIKGLKINPSEQIVLHLDHGSSVEACINAIKIGFSSVMIDASKLPFKKNADATKRVIEFAKKYNVSVESEIGILYGTEDENTKSDIHEFTIPEMAEKFVNETHTDSLAIAIGTSHGVYKPTTDTNKLRFDILSNIQSRMENTPLVLHGASIVPQRIVETINKFGGKITASQGIDPHQLYITATKTHICKINMDTDLRLAFTSAVRQSLYKTPENINPREYLSMARDNVCNNCLYAIREIMNSENKI